MNEKKKFDLAILDEWIYPLLLFVVGVILIRESERLTIRYKPANWLSGPSGFMMIIGVILIFLTVFESTKIIIKKFRKKKVVSENIKTPDNVQVDTEHAEVTANLVNNYQGDSNKEMTKEEETAYKKQAWFSFALLFGYTFLIKPLGFVLSTVFYLVANLLILKNSVKRTMVTGVVIFIILFWGAPSVGLSLPRGILGI